MIMQIHGVITPILCMDTVYNGESINRYIEVLGRGTDRITVPGHMLCHFAEQLDHWDRLMVSGLPEFTDIPIY